MAKQLDRRVDQEYRDIVADVEERVRQEQTLRNRRVAAGLVLFVIGVGIGGVAVHYYQNRNQDDD